MRPEFSAVLYFPPIQLNTSRIGNHHTDRVATGAARKRKRNVSNQREEKIGEVH